MKYDNGKTDLSLIPVEALVDVADVLDFGAKKYGRDNHRLDGHKTEWSRTYASAQRHLLDFWSGQDLDPESGKKHITHAITQLIILATAINDGHTNMDDRFATRVKQLNTPKKTGGLDGHILDSDLPSEVIEEYIKSNRNNSMYPTQMWDNPYWPNALNEHTKFGGTDKLPNEMPNPTANPGDVTWGINDLHTSLYYNNETATIREYDEADTQAALRRFLNAGS